MHLPDDLALPNLAGESTDKSREGGFMAVVTHEFEPALTPNDIGWLAGLSSLPVVAKGVQRANGTRCGVSRRGRRPWWCRTTSAPAGRRR